MRLKPTYNMTVISGGEVHFDYKQKPDVTLDELQRTEEELKELSEEITYYLHHPELLAGMCP